MRSLLQPSQEGQLMWGTEKRMDKLCLSLPVRHRGICSHDPSVVECEPGLVWHSARVTGAFPHCGHSVSPHPVFFGLSKYMDSIFETSCVYSNETSTIQWISTSQSVSSPLTSMLEFVTCQLSLTVPKCQGMSIALSLSAKWLRIFQEKIPVG